MSDLHPGEENRSPSRTLFNQAWIFKCSSLLTDKRGGVQALLWAAIVNLILFGLFLICATPVYETNDDLAMQLISSGFYTGHPDGHLVYINILIGWALRFLYGAWAGCNWYLLFLLAVHYAALTAIAFLVVSRRGGWLCTSLYTGFFLIVEMRILLHLQFTTAAFLAGTAGVLLVADGLRPGHSVNWPKAIAGFAFTGLMCLIREPAALLLFGVACPFMLERLGVTAWRRLLGTCFAFAGIFLVLHGINRWAYQRDPAWAEFSEYNRMRGEIHVTPLEMFIPSAASAVGWSENDGWMFSHFYFAEPEVYAGVPKMRLFLDKLKMLAQAGPAIIGTILAIARFGISIFPNDARDLMTLAMLNGVWCVLFAGAFRRRWLVTLLISYGLAVALCSYLLATARLPERVAYNLPSFLNAICLYWATGDYSQPRVASRPRWFNAGRRPRWLAKVLHWVALILVAFGVVVYLSPVSQLAYGLWTANTNNQTLKRISHKILGPISSLLQNQKTPILISLPFDSILEQCLIFYPSAAKPPVFLVPNGWMTHSPLFNQILEEHQLRPYSLSLVDREDVFFLMRNTWIEPLRTFYREHYGLNVRFETRLDTDGMPHFEDCHLHLYQAHVVGAKTPIGTKP